MYSHSFLLNLFLPGAERGGGGKDRNLLQNTKTLGTCNQNAPKINPSLG